MQETRSNISNSRQNKTKRLSPVNQKKTHNLVINYRKTHFNIHLMDNN